MISKTDINQNLYNLLTTKNFELVTRDNKGKEAADPKEAELFSFDYKIDDTNYGTVVITITPEGNLEVYYGDALGKGMEKDHRSEWYDFLYQLRHFSRRNMLGFELKSMNKLKYAMKSRSQVEESKYYGYKNTSYTKPNKKAKLKIVHSKPIDEEQGDKRYRNISALYIENADSERFKLPFTKLFAGRAMARHVSNGGTPHDAFGQHICELVSDIGVLGNFVRASRGKEFTDQGTTAMREAGVRHYADLKKKVKRMIGKRGYREQFDQFEPGSDNAHEEITDQLRNMFTETLLDTRIEEAIPVLNKLEARNSVMKEINEFSEWADETTQLELGEGFDPDHFDGKVTVPGPGGLPTDITYTAEIDHEQNRVRVVKCSNDQYRDECQDDAEAEFDNRDVDMPMETSTYGKITDPADNSDAELKREAVHDAILRRLQNNLDLVIKIGGPAEALEAIKQYTDDNDWSDITEIGTSDVSNWVNDIVKDNEVTEGNLKGDRQLNHDLQDMSDEAFLQKRNKKKAEWGPTVFEGKMKDLAMDIEDLSDEEFQAKYNCNKSDWQEVKDKDLRQDPNKPAYIGKMKKEDFSYLKPDDNDQVMEESYTDAEVERAVRIAGHMKGDMTDATDAIEALKKGLTNHPKVKDALRSANESTELDRMKELAGNDDDDYDAKADQDAMDYEAEFDLQDTDGEIGHEIDDNIEVDNTAKSLQDMLKNAGIDYKEIYVDNEGNIEENIEDELDSEQYQDAMRQLMKNAGYDHLDMEQGDDHHRPAEPTQDEIDAYHKSKGKQIDKMTAARLQKLGRNDRLKNFLDTEDDPYDISEDEVVSEGPTRKDFQMVADLLKDNPDIDDRKVKARDYADKFKQMNPRFDSERFLKACGLTEDEANEGNEFSGALAQAKKDGKNEFEVDGKMYQVKEDALKSLLKLVK